jgi:peptidoglycan biosynthesis protein MviN/MurJ (putative lipid II flippase)
VWLHILAQRADQISVRPQWGWQAEQWPALMQAATIMLIGQVAMSFVGPVDQYAAAQLGGNANATFGYANRFISLMLGVGAASVGRAALPVLADIISQGDTQRARSMALRWSLLMILAGLVVALVAWVLAPWGIALLYERGAFTAADTAKVAEVLRWGVMQLPFYFGVLVLVQLLASQQRYRLMASIAVLNFVVKAILTLTLAPRLGVQGIMLATSLMYTSSFVCYFLAASRPVKATTN